METTKRDIVKSLPQLKTERITSVRCLSSFFENDNLVLRCNGLFYDTKRAGVKWIEDLHYHVTKKVLDMENWKFTDTTVEKEPSFNSDRIYNVMSDLAEIHHIKTGYQLQRNRMFR